MARIAFIGLGVMGAPIAGHLARAGHQLTVHNRTAAKAEAWVAAFGGQQAGSPAEAAAGAEVIITCVGDDFDLQDATMGASGAFRSMVRDALFIDHSAVSARLARQLAVEGRDRGVRVVDAPMSGGQAGAVKGQLSLMCGGTKAAFAAAEPIMRAYAARIVHIGRPGAGQQAKRIDRVATAGIIQGLAEAIALARAADLDLDRVFEAMSGGAASSWFLENRWETMTRGDYDFGMAVDLMRKELALAIDEARVAGATLPVAALVDQFYGDVQAMGYGHDDNTALLRRFDRK
ncbi:NAD(P)-dependent oxidoreductase [Sphingomonas quercus]|uniref:NAD(P)-dependent oxidoreductase n=1 Tax=Sphingomonas quercus TaxID=2842451 RepID=A0ABS6BKW2_9SPHN|nr:NAD(P)-dependent oxidoreductase [Sphingomonas quercus]MBU3078446.1 NAD(P)-dependent oxidoreductase [Sphingomonas quercus]